MTPLPSWLRPLQQRVEGALLARRLPPAVLVAGEAGLGKRAFADWLAARLLCLQPVDAGACGQCRSCRWLQAGSHPDCHRLGPEDEEATSIKVDAVRALIGRLQLTGMAGARRVAVVAPADWLNVAAQNALLKTLEEPPPDVHLVLVADAPARLLATVRSRALQLVVTAPPLAEVQAAWQQSGVDAAAAELALRLSIGHPGFGASLLPPERQQATRETARDLLRLADGNEHAAAVADRWSARAPAAVDEALAWLRHWSWQLAGGEAALAPAPARSPRQLATAFRSGLVLRRRLDTPLRDGWLLHEWLDQWRQAG